MKAKKVYESQTNPTYTFKMYRGSNYHAQDPDSSVEYWTNDKDTAKTYGKNITTRTLETNNYFMYDFKYTEFNEDNWIVERLEGHLIKAQLGKDVYFQIWGTEYVIPANCDIIVIDNIIDIFDGSIDLDEEDPNFFEELKYWATTTYIIPT
jgi:hypothetical protein